MSKHSEKARPVKRKSGQIGTHSARAASCSKIMCAAGDMPDDTGHAVRPVARARSLGGLSRVLPSPVSTVYAVRQARRKYLEMHPSDIRNIETVPLPQQLIIRPMEGSQPVSFSIKMAVRILEFLEMEWQDNFVIDDRKFHEVLRLFASLYYFIGGEGYSKSLSEFMGLSISTVNRWLNGHSSPIPAVRLLAFQESDRLTRRIIEERKLGAEIADYQRSPDSPKKGNA